TLTGDDAKTTIIFGNGARGARPPTGTENIRAAYRAGMGSSGNVKAGQISQLMTRPPGVTEVVNPIRASGGADREGLEQARENAPLALMALDRLISVQDYTYFTRTFAGIGKAAAALIPYNRRNIVYITIAGAGDIPIDKGSDLYRNLTKALHDLGDIGITVEVEPRVLVLLLIKAYVKLLDGYQWESVQPRIRAALYSAFGFDMRDLGRSVQQSEVISAIQSIEGVAYVDLEVLEGISGNTTPEELESLLSNLKEGDPRPYIRAEQAGIDPRGGLQPAQLVILSSDPGLADTLILQEVK
ncbi:MAG TPA: putative baseplate assembly protein, partial [Methanotrichaceae archaeon]|nr:putative baseplate assembly protein [Methanotrichaceae archaeon]